MKENSMTLINREEAFELLDNGDFENMGQRIVSCSVTNMTLWLDKDIRDSIESFEKWKTTFFFVKVFKEATNIAVVPLAIRSKTLYGITLRCLEFLPQRWNATYCGPLVRANHSISYDDIVSYVGNMYRFDLVRLTHIPEFIVNDNSGFDEYSVCIETSLCNYENYSSYVAKVYSKSTKQNLRTAKNRIAKNDQSLEIDSEQITKRLFEEIKVVAKTKLIDGKKDQYGKQWQSLFRFMLLKNNKHEIITVRIDSQLVAYRVNLIFNNSVYCIDAAYHRDYRIYSLGMISLDESIKNSFLKGYYYHNEGPGDDYYKTKCIKERVALYSYLRGGNTLIGKVIRIYLNRKN